jgi:uncharacterized RDD family membrane protein YckC
MNTPPSANRFAPPAAHVEDVNTSALELGGRGARLGASLIDLVIQLAVYYGLAFTVFPFLTPQVESGLVISLLVSISAGFLIFVAIQGYLLATQGQTIGKKLVGLRVVRSNGERASFGRLFGLRYLLNGAISLVPFVGIFYTLVDALMIFRQSHQCLHDNIADTIVIKA